MPKSPEFRKVIRVFIASPGDLGEERTRFPQIIAEVNKIKANKKRIHLEPVGWEDTLPGRGRPQRLINKDIKNCELIIMLLWKRWGSSTGKYSSGFEEEYELARSLNQKTKKPDIWLYFRSVPDSMLADPGEQLRQVLDFRSKVEAEKKFLYRAYENVDEWEKLFREHLCRWLDDQPPSAFRISSGPPGTPPEGLLQKYEERIKHLEGELEKRASEQIEIAYTLAREAQEKADSGQITKAEEYFARAAAVSADPRIINDYGLFLMRIGMLAKAEDKFNEVAQLGKAVGDRGTEAFAYNHLGVLYQFRGDLKAAVRMHKKALGIHRELGSQEGMGSAYSNLGILYRTTGELDVAEKMFKKALAIAKRLGRKEGMANSYGNLGTLYQAKGEPDVAEEMFKKALAIDKELGRKEGIANSYGNLGVLYQTRGESEVAEKMFKKVLAIEKRLGREYGMANAYCNLGILYQNQGDLKNAEEMYKKSLAVDERIGRKEGIANVYGNLGVLYKDEGDLNTAEAMYKKAIDMHEVLGKKEGLANNYTNLGILYEDQGHLKPAEEMFKKALDIFVLLGNKTLARKIESLIKEVKSLSKEE